MKSARTILLTALLMTACYKQADVYQTDLPPWEGDRIWLGKRAPTGGQTLPDHAAGSIPPEAVLSEGAVQRFYTQGVPHTDKIGRMRTTYSAADSFFPIIIHAPQKPRWLNYNYRSFRLYPNGLNEVDPMFPDGYGYFQDGNFNTVMIWGSYAETPSDGPIARQFADWRAAAAAHGLQLIVEYPDVVPRGRYPEVLGWWYLEEIGGFVNDGTIASRYQEYERFREAQRPLGGFIGILDNIWTNSVDGESGYFHPSTWGRRWSVNNSDIFAFTIYHLEANTPPDWLKHSWIDPRNLMPLVRLHTGGQKPIWPMLHAYQGEGAEAVTPSPEQMRCEVYFWIVTGATGIAYFTFDSYASRQGQVIGIRPDPLRYYGAYGLPPGDEREATDEELRQSKDLWNAVKQINLELEQLSGVILQSTAAWDYKVYVINSGVYADSPVYTLLKRRGRDYYLFVVHIDAVHATPVYIRELPFGASLDAVLEPYEVRVYQFSETNPVPRALSF